MKRKTSLSLKLRPKNSHKGDYGNLLIVGGQLGMAGAPVLSAIAALRSGAGKVTVAVPHSIIDTVAGFHPSLMTLAVGDSQTQYFRAKHSDEILSLAKNYDVVALGPGLGRHSETVAFAQKLFSEIAQSMVVDADGLFALAENLSLAKSPRGTRVLTPHAGEFSRMSGQTPETDSDRRKAATDFCQRDKRQTTYVVLKGHNTVVASHSKSILNSTGNPGMATAGTGDCLTGIIASQLAIDGETFRAVERAVFVHGLAGDLATKKLGEISMVATDLIDALPGAWKQLSMTR